MSKKSIQNKAYHEILDSVNDMRKTISIEACTQSKLNIEEKNDNNLRYSITTQDNIIFTVDICKYFGEYSGILGIYNKNTQEAMEYQYLNYWTEPRESNDYKSKHIEESHYTMYKNGDSINSDREEFLKLFYDFKKSYYKEFASDLNESLKNDIVSIFDEFFKDLRKTTLSKID